MFRRVSCVELPVSDMEKAVEFYENVLGLGKTYEHPVWTSFDVGETSLAVAVSGTKGGEDGAETCKSCAPCVLRFSAGKMRLDKDVPTATSVIYLAVDDLDAIYRELKDKGVEFLAGPKEQGWGGKTAVMLDPDKNILVLTQA